ncbi:hypothetical protein KQH54_02230 [bacterium]|nr:hypothetical protein [bacterium]
MSVKMSEEMFGGHDCVKLENEALELWITQSVGPRILGLALKGGPNLFADLPGVVLSIQGLPDYQLRGGHRLWSAPEDPTVTYLPDDEPVRVKFLEAALHIVQPVDEKTNVQKTISIYLYPNEAKVRVNHSLTNSGTESVELAAWAITQLKPGGVGILPQAQGNADEHGLLPNRELVLWPYTQLKSPHIDWGDEFIFVHANFTEEFFKVGFPNPRGWIGYAIDGMLFVKKAAYFPGAVYYDSGSSTECYCNSQFIELETLGPKVLLEPGQTVHHREEWSVFDNIEFEATEEFARKLTEQLGLP